MGWLISYDLTKEEQVAELVATREWDRPNNPLKAGRRTIYHSVRGNTLYAVHQNTLGGDDIHEPWIGVYLLRKDKGMGWGYKGMDESMGPNVCDCPLKALKLAPKVENQAWRDRVHAWHERRRKVDKIEPGVAVRFHDWVKDYEGVGLGTGVIMTKHGRGWISNTDAGRFKILRRHIKMVLS